VGVLTEFPVFYFFLLLSPSSPSSLLKNLFATVTQALVLERQKTESTGMKGMKNRTTKPSEVPLLPALIDLSVF
jgi:hypothetical protein